MKLGFVAVVRCRSYPTIISCPRDQAMPSKAPLSLTNSSKLGELSGNASILDCSCLVHVQVFADFMVAVVGSAGSKRAD